MKLYQQLALIVAVGVCAYANAAHKEPKGTLWEAEPPMLQYDTVDGLSQGDVLAITQDDAGHLWVATHRGLNRYDGVEFLNFTKADGLLYNYVTALHTTSAGQIWLTDAKSNLILIDNTSVTSITPLKGLSDSVVREFVRFRGRFVFATEDAGLFSLPIGNLDATPALLRGSQEKTSQLSVWNDALWFVQDNQLFKWSGGSDVDIELVQENVVSSYMLDGVHWLVNEQREVGVLKDGWFSVRHTVPGTDPINNIVAGRTGDVWISTDESVYGFLSRVDLSGERREEFVSFPDLAEVNTLYIDHEDTLWLGRYGGLYRHLGNRFTHYRNRFSANSSVVWVVTQDDAGNFYYGTGTSLLKHSTNRVVTDLSARYDLPSGRVRVVESYVDGVLYVGVAGRGLFRLDTQRDVATLVAGTANQIILDSHLDGTGRLWLATDGAGILTIDVDAAGPAVPVDDSSKGPIYSLSEDPAGNIWYGVDEDGLGVLRPMANGQYRHEFYGEKYGLTDKLFSHVEAAGENEVWLAGEDSVLIHFKEGQTRDYTRDSPMSDQNVYSVFVQDDGSLLLGGEKGVFFFDPATLYSRGLSLLHGFMGLEVNAHANFLDRDGYLWFGTIDGATRMDLRYEMPTRVPITPQVLSARTQKTQTGLTPGSQVEYSDNGMQFVFDGVSLLEPHSVEYSYRLVGHDINWSTPDRSRSVNYSGLPPGQYRFEVRARYLDGQWFFNNEAFSFEVLAPFWLKRWFLLSVLAAILFVLYAGYAVRTRAIKRHNLKLRREVDDRTKSIEEGHRRLVASNEQLLQESEERRLADIAREEVETRFRVAFQSTPIGMAFIDRDGLILNSNRAYQEMFVRPERRQDGRLRINALTFVDEEDRGTMRTQFLRLLNDEYEYYDTECSCIAHDGELLNARLFLTAVRNEQGEFVYCIVQIQDITEARRLTDALEYQASYDELTGLVNRRSFQAALQKAHKQSEDGDIPSYLVLMDLDQFKIVNDTSGHLAGDELLRQVSQIIRDQVRADDTVARLGGDEFGLILWRCPNDVAHRVAESIRAAVEDFQFQWDTNTYRIGVSMGAVRVDQSLGTIEEITQLADAACYHSKDAGRNRVHFVQGDGESVNEKRGEVRWVQRLNEAMDNSSFALYGQFIRPVEPIEGEPERMEVLLRMRDPDSRKLIPPGAFLPSAERYGLIVKLDKWVVENLFKTLYLHQSFGSLGRRYWINLSGSSVGDKRFVDFLIDAVKNCRLPEGMINFEITETAVIRNVGEAGRMMSALHDMGCQFALDDFGSGLSSFGYLKKLPVDFIKIDGMFIRDILTDEIDRIFVRSIIDIARTMNIKSIAEFVENDQILNAVKELGIDYVQGFGVHRPETVFAELPMGAMIGPDPEAENKLILPPDIERSA
ncbi:MAG: EAL domain-containing protein [Pseudomonadota bacterium]